MQLRSDRMGMAVLMDALIFMLALMVLTTMLIGAQQTPQDDNRAELLRSYHSVLLSSEISPQGNDSSNRVTLADYLVALSLTRTHLDVDDLKAITLAVKGTLLEVSHEGSASWLIVEVSGEVLTIGDAGPGKGEVFADRRELGDGSATSTLYLEI